MLDMLQTDENIKERLLSSHHSFDYTEWPKKNLFEGMSVAEISDGADKYGRENP
jgi:hypothetical protein